MQSPRRDTILSAVNSLTWSSRSPSFDDYAPTLSNHRRHNSLYKGFAKSPEKMTRALLLARTSGKQTRTPRKPECGSPGWK